MRDGEIDFLRRRISMERTLAENSACEVAATLHLRMLRLYEVRLEREAADIVEMARPMDARMVEAMRMVA